MKLALDGHESKVCFFIKILNSEPTRDPQTGNGNCLEKKLARIEDWGVGGVCVWVEAMTGAKMKGWCFKMDSEEKKIKKSKGMR